MNKNEIVEETKKRMGWTGCFSAHESEDSKGDTWVVSGCDSETAGTGALVGVVRKGWSEYIRVYRDW